MLKNSQHINITIITICYNAVDTIGATINSLIMQDYDNYQYIVIDGGSADGTLDVIKANSNKIDIWVSEPDKGIYNAMNKGLEKATGDFVYFLNAGDEFVDRYVLSNVASLLKDTVAEVFCGKVWVTNDIKNKQVIDTYPKYKIYKQNFRNLFDSSFCHQALFVSRSAYLRVGGFDERFKIFADFYTIAKIIKDAKLPVYIDVFVAYFNGSGVSSDWRKLKQIESEKKGIFHLLAEDESPLKELLRAIKNRVFILKKNLLYACFNR